MKREHLAYMAGHLSLVGITFVFNLLAARLLGPDQMGIWQTANLISIYGSIATFGVLNGMSREVPVRLGRGDSGGVAEVVATTLTPLLLLLSGLVMAGILAIYMAPQAGLAVGLGLVLLAARQFNGFSMMLVRSHQEFVRLGLHQGFSAVALALGALAIWASPTLPTLLLAMSLSLTLCGALAFSYMHVKPVQVSTLRYLAGIGAPIMLAGFLFSLLTTVDRVLIIVLLGSRELGLYTPVISVLGALMIAPGLVSNVMYPRMGHLYGKTGSHRELLPLVSRMIRLNYLATLPIAAALGMVFYFLVVPYFLPGYEDSRIPLALSLLAALFLPLGQSMGDLFNVIGWQRLYLRNMAIGMAVNCLAGYLLTAEAGLGLSGVALGTVAGMAAYALCQWYTYIVLKKLD
jgi:O-antigen/teichoic acid export membrane protein